MLIIIISVALVLLITAGVLFYFLILKKKNTNVFKPYDYWINKLNEFNADWANNQIQGQTMFIGDSNTDGWNGTDYLKNAGIVNYGIGGDTTRGVLYRFDTIVCKQPSKIFLMIGTNDIQGNDTKELMERYNLIITLLLQQIPNVKIFIQSILPVNQIDFMPTSHFINNDIVNSFNIQVKTLANAYNLQYFDINSLVKDSSGKTDKNNTVDGIHLNSNGYAIWWNVVKDFV
jgi:lysophospholipase L1-like esterase